MRHFDKYDENGDDPSEIGECRDTSAIECSAKAMNEEQPYIRVKSLPLMTARPSNMKCDLLRKEHVIDFSLDIFKWGDNFERH